LHEGRERRRHRALLTRNTEYHFRGLTCVGVRDRRTGCWDGLHPALFMRATTALAEGWSWGRPGAGKILPGTRAVLKGEGNGIVTSPIEEIIRPPKAAVEWYLSD